MSTIWRITRFFIKLCIILLVGIFAPLLLPIYVIFILIRNHRRNKRERLEQGIF